MRRVRKMTQQQLSDATGINRSSLGLIEVSRRGISLGEAALICEALDVELGAMISAEPLTLTIRTQVD